MDLKMSFAPETVRSMQHAAGLHFTDKGRFLVVYVMDPMCIFNIYRPAQYIIYNF